MSDYEKKMLASITRFREKLESLETKIHSFAGALSAVSTKVDLVMSSINLVQREQIKVSKTLQNSMSGPTPVTADGVIGAPLVFSATPSPEMEEDSTAATTTQAIDAVPDALHLKKTLPPPAEMEEDFTEATSMQAIDAAPDTLHHLVVKPLLHGTTTVQFLDAVPDAHHHDDLSAQTPLHGTTTMGISFGKSKPGYAAAALSPTTTEEIDVFVPETPLHLVDHDQSFKLASCLERTGLVPVADSFGAEYTFTLAHRVFDELPNGPGNNIVVEHGMFTRKAPWPPPSSASLATKTSTCYKHLVEPVGDLDLGTGTTPPPCPTSTVYSFIQDSVSDPAYADATSTTVVSVPSDGNFDTTTSFTFGKSVPGCTTDASLQIHCIAKSTYCYHSTSITAASVPSDGNSVMSAMCSTECRSFVIDTTTPASVQTVTTEVIMVPVHTPKASTPNDTSTRSMGVIVSRKFDMALDTNFSIATAMYLLAAGMSKGIPALAESSCVGTALNIFSSMNTLDAVVLSVLFRNCIQRQLKIMSGGAEMRPIPWPSFSMGAGCDSYVEFCRLWKPPWPLLISHQRPSCCSLVCQEAKQQRGGGSCELTFIGEFKRMVGRLPWSKMMLMLHLGMRGHGNNGAYSCSQVTCSDPPRVVDGSDNGLKKLTLLLVRMGFRLFNCQKYFQYGCMKVSVAAVVYGVRTLLASLNAESKGSKGSSAAEQFWIAHPVLLLIGVDQLSKGIQSAVELGTQGISTQLPKTISDTSWWPNDVDTSLLHEFSALTHAVQQFSCSPFIIACITVFEIITHHGIQKSVRSRFPTAAA